MSTTDSSTDRFIADDHPLLAKTEINALASNDLVRWLKEWAKATSYEHLETLLHHGYTTLGFLKPAYQAERLSFYLRVADGFAQPQDAFQLETETSSDHPDVRWQMEYRQRLAVKALKMVATCVLVSRSELSDRNLPWHEIIAKGDALESVLHFLRPSAAGDEIPNLATFDESPAFREIKVVRRFALELVQGVWDTRGFERRFGGFGRHRSLLESSKPQLITILHALGAIHRLQDVDAYPFDEACWARLEGLALRPINVAEEHHREQLHTPADLDEAVALGSKVAPVLMARRIQQSYAERQAAIAAAAAKREAADDELRQLRAG